MELNIAPHPVVPGVAGPRRTQIDPFTLDWADIAAALDECGYATVAGLIDPPTCRDLAALYDDKARFRSRVVMERYRFGKGEYKYLAYPLPEPVAALRQGLYPGLAAIANRWCRVLGEGEKFPPALDAYLETCHAAGQTRPTPLILKYGAGDYNCLHQDLYGELVFPLQLTVLLSDPARDFTGGEFVLVEQRPRSQSKASVVPLGQGEAVIFPVHHRPVAGTRGVYRATMRHGVSPLRGGQRFTLGIIFHDAA
ncbi:MAG TPA: 2OG-Fe(II) oxygenase [Stellaceae bacterium]|nr:2OG-Fe(II) oxygenase [Stellaceae bacterium]